MQIFLIIILCMSFTMFSLKSEIRQSLLRTVEGYDQCPFWGNLAVNEKWHKTWNIEDKFFLKLCD